MPRKTNVTQKAKSKSAATVKHQANTGRFVDVGKSPVRPTSFSPARGAEVVDKIFARQGR